jgi:hypothetical protein
VNTINAVNKVMFLRTYRNEYLHAYVEYDASVATVAKSQKKERKQTIRY